jgi:hypothetical protein
MCFQLSPFSCEDFFHASSSRTKSGRMNQSIVMDHRDLIFRSFHESNAWIHHPILKVPMSHLISTCCCIFRIQEVKENNGPLLHLALFDSRYLSMLDSHYSRRSSSLCHSLAANACPFRNSVNFILVLIGFAKYVYLAPTETSFVLKSHPLA